MKNAVKPSSFTISMFPTISLRDKELEPLKSLLKLMESDENTIQ